MTFGGAVSLLLLLMLSLSSCAYTTTNDPLAVAQVNGTTISLSAYQMILPFSIARLEYSESNPDANNAVPPVDWRIASKRGDYAQAQQDTLDLLIDLELLNEQLHTQHINVSTKSINNAKSLIIAQQIALQQQLTQDPTNSALSALVASFTQNVVEVYARQTAGLEALAQSGKLPQARVYEITVAKRQQAQQVLEQAQHGVNFEKLAQKYSTEGPASSDLGSVFAGQFTFEAYLAAQDNQTDQFSAGVGAAFDKAVFVPQRPPAFVMLPLATGGYGVFAIRQYAQKTLAGIASQNVRITYVENWIANTLYPRATIRQYIVVG